MNNPIVFVELHLDVRLNHTKSYTPTLLSKVPQRTSQQAGKPS